MGNHGRAAGKRQENKREALGEQAGSGRKTPWRQRGSTGEERRGGQGHSGLLCPLLGDTWSVLAQPRMIPRSFATSWPGFGEFPGIFPQVWRPGSSTRTRRGAGARNAAPTPRRTPGSPSLPSNPVIPPIPCWISENSTPDPPGSSTHPRFSRFSPVFPQTRSRH